MLIDQKNRLKGWRKKVWMLAFGEAPGSGSEFARISTWMAWRITTRIECVEWRRRGG